MQYFTKELWLRINSQNEDARLKAEEDWKLRNIEYQHQFEIVQKYLPPRFTKFFLSRDGLHDYSIVEIVLTNQARISACELKLSNGEESVLIKLIKLKSVQMDIESFDYCRNGKLSWGYSEFEITPQNTIKLSVLCDINNEIAVEFEKISLKSAKKKRNGIFCNRIIG